MTMFLLLNIFFLYLFIKSSHPVSMTIIIMLQTLTMSLSMSLVAKTYWMSYILFLVFLGGMLVLFLYITSLAPNEMFSANPPTLANIITWPLMAMGWITLLLMDQPLLNIFTSNIDNHLLTSPFMMTSNSTQYSMLLKLFNSSSGIITLIVITYLLLTLIAVVKITNIHSGPLRSSLASMKNYHHHPSHL
nr:NADH dehydrogenase subunit 6 [Rhomboptera ligata]